VKNIEASLVGNKEIDLEVNADKTKYMVMSGDQRAVRSHNIKTENNPPERVEKIKYLGTTLKNQNLIQEDMKSRGCLLSFGAESFVFQFAIQKYKD